MYLLDTNVISAFAPSKPRTAETDVLGDWLSARTSHLFLSVVTASEVRSGIENLRRKGATRKADDLTRWWSAIEHLYRARLLPFTLPAATTCGILLEKARAAGSDPDFEDAAIAATAVQEGMQVVTFNARHFSPMLASFVDARALPSRT